MIIKVKRIGFLGLLFLVFLFKSCIDCEPENNFGTTLKITFIGDTANFQTINGLGIDEPLYKDTSFSEAFFPVDRSQNTSAFIFSTTNSTDTITLTYEIESQNIAPDCGFIEHLKNIDLVYNSFDSGYVSNNEVIFRDTTNVVIRIRITN